MAVGPSDPQSRDSIRESELTHALAAVRSRLAMAAERAGRNVGEIELLAYYQILSGNRCCDFVSIGLSVSRRIAGTRSVGKGGRPHSAGCGFPADGFPRSALAHGGPDSAQQSPIAGPLGAHRALDRQLATGIRPRSGGDGDAGRRPTGQPAARVRSGQPGRRCVPRRRRRDDARGGRRGVCAGRGRGRAWSWSG